MDATFEVFWGTLKAALKERTYIRNWTVKSGYIGNDFTAWCEGENIPCEFPEVIARRKDFEVMWEIWDEYLVGEVKRQEFTPDSHNTKYVISIMHHFMES